METLGIANHASSESAEHERGVLERCRAGDAEAFSAIVSSHMKRAYFTALGLVGNHADALDLSQEAFVRAYRSIRDFDPSRRFFTWYYVILRNVCLNHLRKSGRTRNLGDSENEHEIRAEEEIVAADPAVLAEQNDLNMRLWTAIGRLKAEDREVLILREFDGCSYAEIAQRLNIPQGTVMSRLFNARKHLRERLSGEL